ncbi:MAG: hypothetical protein ACTSU5_06055 [Promethearchaeota archaeon]
MLVDSHVHTGFSGCRREYSPVKVVWERARAAGLDRIGISNHCDPSNSKCDHVRVTRREIEREGLGDRVRQGVELNVNEDPNVEGRSDLFIPRELWGELDFVNIGEHVFFHALGGFLAESVGRGDWDAVDEYLEAKTSLVRDAFDRYPEITGGHAPRHAVWVHPWLWEAQNGFFFVERVFDFTAPVLELMVDRGISFEVNGFLFRTYNLPPEPLLKSGTDDEHYSALVHFYTELLRVIRDEYPSLKYSLGSDAHTLGEIGDLWMPGHVARKAGIPKTRIIDL